MHEWDKISRFYNENERRVLSNMSKLLFKERLKIALDQRRGTNGLQECSPKFHANVMGVDRTTIMRYTDPKSSVFPSFENLFLLIEYIKIFVPNFNVAFLFDENAKMITEYEG